MVSKLDEQQPKASQFATSLKGWWHNPALGRYQWGVSLLLYTLCALVLTHPLIFELDKSLVGLGGDGDHLWFVWLLWWFKQAIETGQDPAYTNLVFSLLPQVQIFVVSFFNELIALPLQWLVSPVAAYNLLLLSSFILSGFTMYFLAGEFVKSKIACFVAGFLYSFSTYHFARTTGHMGLATMEWLPFCAWRVFVFYRRPNIKNAALAGLSLALVCFSDTYYLAYFALPFGLFFLVWKLVTDFSWFKQVRHLTLGVLVLVVTVAIVWFPLHGFLKVDQDIQQTAKLYSEGSIEILSADLLSYVLPNEYNPTFGDLTRPIYNSMRSPYPVEKSAFLGYMTLLLAGIGFVFRQNRTRTTLFWLGLALFGGLLSFGPKVYVAGQPLFGSPFYKLLYDWPFLSNYRGPNRLAIVPLLALCVLAAFGVNSLISRFGRPQLRYKAVLVVLTGLVLLFSLSESLLFGFSIAHSPFQTSPVYQQIAAQPGNGLLLDLPVFPLGSYHYYQTIHHKRLVSGYISRVTPQMSASVTSIPYLEAFVTLSGPKPESLKGDIYPIDVNFESGLRNSGIEYIVLHRNILEPTTYNWMRKFLDDNLPAPFYDSPGEGVVAWHIEAKDQPQLANYRFKIGKGWLEGIGLRDGRLERSVQQDGQLLIEVPVAEEQNLRFMAMPYLKPMTLEVRLNGQIIKSMDFPKAWVTQEVDLGKIKLNPGQNILEFHAVQGCSRPIEFDNKSPDTRCFSFGIQQLQILP